MASLQDLEQQITPGVSSLVKLAKEIQNRYKHSALCDIHWLEAVLERHMQMAASVAGWPDSSVVLTDTTKRLTSGDIGKPLDVENLLQEAIEAGERRGKPRASESEVVEVILGRCGHKVIPQPAPTSGAATTVRRPSGPASYTSKTPSLDLYGRDLTAEAREGRLPTVVGRDNETQLVLETLCRRTKCNPVLLGPAGVGKTAVVEGLALRIVRGEVPASLRDCRVIALQPSVLTAGASHVGDLEKRMQGITRDACQPGIILFIDEIHSIMGAGGMQGTSDIASQLKPSLARGEIRCIGATTSNEYRLYIERDEALERRFQPVRIQELNRSDTLTVLKSLRDLFQQSYGVAVSDNVLSWMIQFSNDYMKNRNFPDKAIDLLEQCVAHAVSEGCQSVDRAAAEQVSQRLVGVPLNLTHQIAKLRDDLKELGLATEADIDTLADRLPLSMRGLDIHPERPAAVILLLGQAAAHCERLVRTIAECLFGSEDRITDIDMSGYTHWNDTSRLIGAGAGYIGYSDQLPIHALVQMPFSVLLLRGMQQCNHAVRDLLTQAIATGSLTDGRGRKIYLSDAIVVISAECPEQYKALRHLGLRSTASDPGSRESEIIADLLGDRLAAEVDVVFQGPDSETNATVEGPWRMLLNELQQRYLGKGLILSFDASVLAWMAAASDQHAGPTREWERSFEQQVSKALAPFLDSDDEPNGQGDVLYVSFSDNRLKIDRKEGK